METASRLSFAAPLAIVVVFGLLVAYAGLYAALLEPHTRLQMNSDGECRSVYTAEYRVGGRLARYAFLPIHGVDRRVRPGFWNMP